MKSDRWYEAIREANSRPRSIEHRRKLAEARTDSFHTIDTRRQMSLTRKTNLAEVGCDNCTMCGSTNHSTRIHQSKLIIGRLKSKIWREAVARSNSDRKTGGRASKETRRKMSRSQLEVQGKPEMRAWHSEHSKLMWLQRSTRERRELSKKLSLAQVGRKPGSFGYRCYYEGRKGKISMRSTWEVAFAAKLDKWKIDWKYESVGFVVGKGNWNGRKYYPDFYLAEFDLHVEVKGYLRADNRRKLRAFRRKYPDVHWMLLDKTALEQLGVL